MTVFRSRRRREPRDRQREFIYLDEVSVVSLLAGLQGEIKEAVTQTLARTEEHSIGASVGTDKTGAKVDSRLGGSQTSTNEVVRRAVIQSTFRDLWRRDVGVLLHDISGSKRRARKMLLSPQHLEKALPRLKRSKLAVPLRDIQRGDLVEMDVRVEADQFFKMITIGTTFLDLLRGREDVFGVSAAELGEFAPIVEVLKELLVGLVPMRGVATSHSIVEIAGEQVVIATELLGTEVRAHARPLELVGFAEAGSFWRDLRRTLFSGATYTVYARAEGPALDEPWSPIKIADLLASLSPEFRDAVVLPLQTLDLNENRPVETPDATVTARFQLEGFSAALKDALGTNPDAMSIKEAIDGATLALASASTVDERRRAFEPVAQVVAGGDPDRDLVLTIRSRWISQLPSSEADRPETPPHLAGPPISPIELEVGFVALYW